MAIVERAAGCDSAWSAPSPFWNVPFLAKLLAAIPDLGRMAGVAGSQSGREG